MSRGVWTKPNPTGLVWVVEGRSVPDVTRTDPEGVDYGWVMQVTFVLTVLIGAPVVGILSLVGPELASWEARAGFAIRVGALVWLVTAVLTYSYARMGRL